MKQIWEKFLFQKSGQINFRFCFKATKKDLTWYKNFQNCESSYIKRDFWNRKNCTLEFAEKLGPKHVFGRKIARRRNYEARTGRSILKRQGLGGASESVRPENGRKVENGPKILVVLWSAETHIGEISGCPKSGLQCSVRDDIWTVWKVTAKRRVWKGRNWPPTAKKTKNTTTTDTDDDFLLLLLIILIPSL